MWNQVFKERIKLNACIPTIFNGFIFQQKHTWLKEANAVFLFWCITEDVGMFYTKLSKQLNISNLLQQLRKENFQIK